MLTVPSQFSQVVAVGPFSMLGVVMLASISRVCRITGITSVYEEIASSDVQNVLAANDDLTLANTYEDIVEDEWDLGEVIQREE